MYNRHSHHWMADDPWLILVLAVLAAMFFVLMTATPVW
jgi:hypothetical protein